MQRIIIENFGPIQHLDLEIKDLSLFIGEQATGKSTVAKLIYFFKSLRGDLIDYLYNTNLLKEEIVDHFWKGTTGKFLNIFQINKQNLSNFQIIYQYGDGKYFLLNKRKLGFMNSEKDSEPPAFEKELGSIFDKIDAFRKQYYSQETALTALGDFPKIKADREYEINSITKKINLFFCDDREFIFIPASRSFITANSDLVKKLPIDFLSKNFMERINFLKPGFRKSTLELIEDKRDLNNILLNDEVLMPALQKINAVLKGEYRVDTSGESIFFNENDSIPLSMASSGQQEAVWILMQIFLLLLNREKVFLVIEEPEAHLSPEAQKSVVELITLLLKENGSQVLITTHSPYILTAFNNLIYAGNVGKEHAEEVGKIIPPQLWINSEQVGAYKLRAGTSEDLMDRETKLIRAEELDSVSQSINQAFDAILNLELQ